MTAWIELLDARVAAVGHVHVILRVYRKAAAATLKAEFAVATASLAPFLQQIALRVEGTDRDVNPDVGGSPPNGGDTTVGGGGGQ